MCIRDSIYVVVFVDESSYVFFNIKGAHLLEVELATVLDTGPILRHSMLARLKKLAFFFTVRLVFFN